MILFPKEIEWGPPGKCIICEGTPDRDKVPVISCQRLLDVGHPFHLAGNKFLCSDCVKTAMVVLGWTLPEAVKEKELEINVLKGNIITLEEEIKTSFSLNDAMHILQELGFKHEGDCKCGEKDLKKENVNSTIQSSKSKTKKLPV